MESIFNKVSGKISAFCNFIENSVMGIGIFRKVVLLKISRNFLLIRAVDLHSTGRNATKNIS